MSRPIKPIALQPGATISIVSTASPVEESKLEKGIAELKRLGYAAKIDSSAVLARDGYFAGSLKERASALRIALMAPQIAAVICSRGGYGSNYLLPELMHNGFAETADGPPRIFVGYSDVTSLQIFFWQKYGWITFYGPMVAAAFDAGADQPSGYDLASFERAVSATQSGWTLDLKAETMLGGECEGTLMGGCMTLVETSMGTPWELDTRGSILLLEDRGMKPYQVDRSLMHLKQAGKFDEVRGIILGEFPDSEAPAGSASVREIAERILNPLDIPIVWGVPVGHTARPMLTIPLGIRAYLSASKAGRLQILEPACVKPRTS
jgi:muramoyltetrapeptide carboxypeptidase